MQKHTDMEQIRSDIVANNICAHLAEQAQNLVLGSGSLDANIVFIGEAPGAKEDASGEPFVGAAGNFLNEMLASVELNREDVYITNIVKYRPPNNRDPEPEEKREFWPYLLRQLRAIQPQVIVTLGRHSMENFIPGAKIGQIHGQPRAVKLDDMIMQVVPLYHPAAALYNGSMRQTLLDDFQTVVTVAEK